MILFAASPIIMRPPVFPVEQVATTLAVSTQPSGAVDGDPFTTQPVVQVRDANGNVVTGSGVTITAALASGSGTLGGDTTQAAVNGVATFTDLEVVGTGTHSLTFTATGLTSATSSEFDVTAAGGGTITALLQIDWSNSTGTDVPALGDGGKCPPISPVSSEQGEVLANPGNLGFPSTMVNILRVRPLNGGRGGWLELQNDDLGEIAIGETRTFRWYQRIMQQNMTNGSTDNSHHSTQDGLPVGSGSNQNWNLSDVTGDASAGVPSAFDPLYENAWAPFFLLQVSGERFYLNTTSPHHASQRLVKGTVYRHVFQMYRIDTTTYRVKAWVYSSAASAGDEVLLGAPSAWKSQIHAGETMDSNRAYTYSHVENTAAINQGCNGTTATSYPVHYKDMGGFAVTSSLSGGPAEGTPLGAYGVVTGEG